MSYLASWIIIIASASHISAQGFYAGAGGGNGYGGNAQANGGFGGPGQPQQRPATPQLQGRMDAGNPQQPNQQSGMLGLPVIFTNPTTSGAADAASPAVGSSAAQMPAVTGQGQQPLVNSALSPSNTVPIGTGVARPVLAAGATLPVASPLYAGVSASGLYGGRLMDAGLSRYPGYGNGLDDQWGTAGLGGYGNDRYGLYGSGYGDEFGGAGGYGRNEGYGNLGQYGRGGQGGSGGGGPGGNSGYGGQGGSGGGGPGGNSGYGGQGGSGGGGPGGNRGGWNL